ncbi:serine/threonine protein phosphatase [Leptospira perolatii]|uniref:Serine/threonine protein phosphatase n=1 Tax=Leptospira perolatii TaxID=2023191 RepID=A0A2M9ZIK0_9LEPT|nr:SpoIIE family protein phosphatase [Leptospira perolatii]PJZ69085.1 serine/threonine protein phosphatase [Leptospira perolatii]PJZ71794.1 serine/threonine protein phosphatase [Leptospira perolatii]
MCNRKGKSYDGLAGFLSFLTILFIPYSVSSESPRFEWGFEKSVITLSKWNIQFTSNDPQIEKSPESEHLDQTYSLGTIPDFGARKDKFATMSLNVHCGQSIAGQSLNCPYRAAVYLPFCFSGCILLRDGFNPELRTFFGARGNGYPSRPRIVPIEGFDGDEKIEVVLFPFSGPRMLRENPVFGTFEEIQSIFLVKALKIFFFTSLELFSFLFFLFIYLRRRKDQFNLSFSILNLSLAVWYPSYEGWSNYVWDSPWSTVIFGYCLGALLPILFHEFTRQIFKSPRFLLGTVLEVCFVFHISWPALEYGLTGSLLLFEKYAYNTFIIVLCLFFLHTIQIFVLYRNQSIISFKWVASGLVLVALSSLFTVLSLAGLGHASPWVNESFLGLTLLFSLALAKRYAEVFRALEKSQSKLKILNELLETKVEARTKIIKSQKQELERKGRILAKDLFIAGKIQSSLLPKELPIIPNARLAFRYQPMMEVGGDLLDVIYDHESSALGLFIGDVTGHGVSAALVASMLKMTLGDWGEFIHDPSSLLLNIKGKLDGKLDGHFITATFVTIDLQTGTAMIANAGHPECLILRSDGKVEFYRPKGVAIYESVPSDYETEIVQMHPGDKIVLYTDGIPDARNQGGDFFGEEALSLLLSQNSALTPEQLCDTVLNGIQLYRGNNPSENQDDIALLIAEFTGHPASRT